MGRYEFVSKTQTYISKYISNHYKAKPSNHSNLTLLKPYPATAIIYFPLQSSEIRLRIIRFLKCGILSTPVVFEGRNQVLQLEKFKSKYFENQVLT